MPVPRPETPKPPAPDVRDNWLAGTQWLLAGLIGLSMFLLGWRGWNMTRFSVRPIPIERNAFDPSSNEDPPPRVVRGAGPGPAQPPATAKKKPPEITLDLNKASALELQRLPGIGPTLSERIIQRRPFSSVEDLRKVKGIGPKTFEAIRSHVHVEAGGK